MTSTATNGIYTLPLDSTWVALQIINSKLTVIGGRDYTTNKITNKVTTYTNNNWSNEYINLLKARVRPGVLTHLDYAIVAGGTLDYNTFSDDIELLNYKQLSHWLIARMKLPEAMWYGTPLWTIILVSVSYYIKLFNLSQTL